MKADAGGPPPKGTRMCPICGKPVNPKFDPFCSRHCTNIDLNRWLSGRYVIPGSDDEPAPPDDPE